MIGYDKVDLDYKLLFHLQEREGAGLLAHDSAKPHHILTLHGPPTWVSLARGLSVLDFNGAGDYLDCPAAMTADMDFTSGDYSIGGWIYHNATATSKMIIGRYGLDLDGWELYLYDSITHFYLQLRHHHGSLATDRTGCYSQNWVNGAWHFFGISRSGAYPLHYRNGDPVPVTYDPSGLNDPDPCNRDLVVGCRYTKNTDWYAGQNWGLRVWDRALSAEDWMRLFYIEKGWFGM